MKSKTRAYVALTLIATAMLVSAAFNLAKFRPLIQSIPVAEIDAVGQRTGITDCFWFAAYSKDALNYAFIDEGATYWLTKFQLPPGATLEFTGEFPHARYLSFVTYDKKGIPLNSLLDSAIKPDEGSINPFVTGARRDASQRSYTFRTVKPGSDANGMTVASANALVLNGDDEPSVMMMRVYIPDHGLDAKGGVQLPTPVLKLADGSKLSGDAMCRQIVQKQDSAKYVQLGSDAMRDLLQMSSVTTPHHPAQPVPTWEAFRNPPYLVSGLLAGTTLDWIRKWAVGKPTSGMLASPDNSYMFSYVDSRFGDVLVLTGKAATTPPTAQGTSVMAPAQLRYWSVCKYHSLGDTKIDPNACVNDEQAPKDSQGQYTIIVSSAGNRPTNANYDCGMGWINWGRGDALDNPQGGLVLFRNMLPAPDFKHSVFDVHNPGEEASALGEYFPRAKYMSRQEVEKLGCRKGA